MSSKFFRKIMSALLAVFLSFNGMLIPAKAESQVKASGNVYYEKLTAAPADGAKVIIFNPSSAVAMTSSVSGSNVTGVIGTLSGGKLVFAETMAVLTVAVSNGVYTFKTEDGKYLTSGATGKALSFGTDGTAGLAKWTLQDKGDGKWSIVNTTAAYNGTLQALQLYNGNFSTFGLKDDDAYKFEFYVLAENQDDPVTPPVTDKVRYEKLTEAPADGTKVIIYHPTSKMVLTSQASSNKLKGTSATASDDKIVITDEMEILTVSVTDGSYTFQSEDGKYLTSGQTGGSLSFAASGTSDLAKWSLNEISDGKWSITNVGAAYSGNHNQALEYFNSLFTTYGFKTSDNAYIFEFYGEPEKQPEGLVTDLSQLSDGAKIVIYNEYGKKAMSSAAVSDYYRGVGSVTITEDKVVSPEKELVWTVGIETDAEGNAAYSFTSSTNEKLSLDASHNSLPLGDVNDTWTISETSTENGYYIRNKNRTNNYVMFDVYNQTEEFTSKTYSASNDGKYVMKFYLIADSQEEPPVPPTPSSDTYFEKLAEAPEDGSTLVIYHPSSGMVLTAKDSDGKLAGTEGTLSDKGLAVTEDMVILTAEVSEDVYKFKSEDGKYLTSGATGNALTFATDGASDLAKWTLEDASDGKWYIRSVGAAYQGNHNQALEYYSNNSVFTTYGIKTTAAYQFEFYGKSIPAEGKVTDLSQLSDGATVVVYNASGNKAMSSILYKQYYRDVADVTITDGLVVNPAREIVWTVGIQTDAQGNKLYTFISLDNSKLTTNNEYMSLPHDGPNETWKLEPAKTIKESFFMISAGKPSAYIEYYKNTNKKIEEFSTFGYNESNEAIYAMELYLVKYEEQEPPVPTTLEPGKKYVIYNAAEEGGNVIGLPDELGASLKAVPAQIVNDLAVCQNGAVLFTVGVSGDYYTFANNGKYLATKDSEELFMSDTLSDTGENCTYWKLEKQGNGYLIASKTARYNSSGVVYIEYYGNAFSGWTFKSATPGIFTFNFYEVGEDTPLYNDVVNNPAIIFASEETAIRNKAYTCQFTLDDVCPDIANVTAVYKIGEQTYTVEAVEASGGYEFVIPAEQTNGEKIEIEVTVTRSTGESYKGQMTVTLEDSLDFEQLTPAPKSETLDEKRPLISAVVINGGENYTAVMKLNDTEVTPLIEGDKISYQPEEDLTDGRVTVEITVTRADGQSESITWYFTVGERSMELYFGQLHSHTSYSDGSGSLEQALSYVAGLPENANVQFVAFTDHSNYFDKDAAAPEGALYDMSLAPAATQQLWAKYRSTVEAFNQSQSDIVAIAGFEMTWSGGPGHINTFNTPGVVSRNNSTLNSKTDDAGLKAYYNLLSQNEGAESLSQFNHPGKTFGNFVDFSYWDALIDSRMFLVEVGNGDGLVGSSAYFPSYEQYTMALDKGWHVAPTNNQDNHRGKWGNSNDARDVILTDDFSEQGIYDAIRAMRIYATEDKNLEIYYTVNGQQLGSQITEIPETLKFHVEVSDPDRKDKIIRVELVANSGRVVYTWDDADELARGILETELAPDYSYYFVRVTQQDGEKAVTAPVWVGETLKLGIVDFKADDDMPLVSTELNLLTELFNSEEEEAVITSMTYTTNGSVVLGTDTQEHVIPAGGKITVSYPYTPTVAKVMTITVTVVIQQDGKEYTYTKDLELDVTDPEDIVYIGIDAAHYNEYVAGNYKDSMGNFIKIAATYKVKAVILETSDDLLAAAADEKYAGLIFTAPSRRDGNALRDPYATYSDEEIAAIKAFNERGGLVVMTGWSDYYENYATFPAADHMAAQQNKVLAALGSHLRVSDDGINDDQLNGGQTQRLYFTNYNLEHPLLKNVVFDETHPNDRQYTEVFSHYGGSSVYAVDDSGNPVSTMPENVEGVVYGHKTTYSKDSDNDGIGGSSVPKYEFEGMQLLAALAAEQQGDNGWIIVSGAAFMSNFEVQASIADGASDSDTQKNYSNYRLCINMLELMHPAKITPISEVRAQSEEGVKYTIEAIVTSNASGYDQTTAFFDCIYVQDDTAGICVFPVSGNYKVGDKVRITGTTDWYQGEPELQMISMELISEGNEVTPRETSPAEIADRSAEGWLVTVSGQIESFEFESGLVQTIMVKDDAGNVARVFIDGYITIDKTVENLEEQNFITVTGLASYDDTFNTPDGPYPRIRVRDRDDIIITVNNNKQYQIIEGADSTWTKGSAENLLIASDAPFDKFEKVTIDNVEVDNSNYYAESGSTRITFSSDYLETLTAGEHAVEVVSSDGKAATTLTIEEYTTGSTDYEIIGSKQIVWTKGSEEGTTIETNAPSEKITGIKVDDVLVEADNYQIPETAENATVNIFVSYLETLTAGEHTVTVVFENNTDSATLTIEEAEAPAEYQITSGMMSQFDKSSPADVAIGTDAPVGKIVEVRIDSETLTAENYEISGGVTSTVTISATYLATLDLGTHQITVVFENNSDDATLTVIDSTAQYHITSSKTVEWTKGSSTDITVTTDAQYTQIKGFGMDGGSGFEDGQMELDSVDGFTAFVLKAAYLETLSEGEHTFKVEFDNNDDTMTIVIKAAQPAEPVEYHITDGDSEHVIGSQEDVVLETDAPADKITGLEIDGEEVDPQYYTVTEENGKTVITIDSEYLDTLGKGEHEITVVAEDGKAETTVTAVEASYTIIKGANSTWVKGTEEGLLIASDAPFRLFDKVKVDGETVAAENYSAQSGSTEITFKPEYLDSLAVGEHTVEIASTNGSASTKLTVEEPEPVEYLITDGADQTWTQGSDEEVILGTDAPADKITGLEIDGETVDPEFYTVTEEDGKTVITIDPNYLETLGEGDHEITVKVEDGKAETTLKIVAPEVTPTPDEPDTGDRSNLRLTFMLMLVSAMGYVFVLRRKED